MALPRSLLLLPIRPTLAGNGLAMRMGTFAEALGRVSQAHVIVVPVAGVVDAAFPTVPGVRLQELPYPLPVATEYALLDQIADPMARAQAFADWGLPRQAAGLTRPLLRDLARRIRDIAPDHVFIGRACLAPCARLVPDGVPLTLDLDEDEAALLAARARQSGDPEDRAWLRHEARAMDALVDEVGHRGPLMLSSAAEARSLAARHPGLRLTVVPNAVTLPNAQGFRGTVPLHAAGRARRALFVGALSYPPNREGLAWLVRALRRHASAPGLDLDIVGTGADAGTQALARHPRVRLRGAVPDLSRAYRTASLAVVPLLSGGGTRLKVLEAAAHGVPVVATRTAMAGLDLPPDSHWRGDTPADFVAAMAAVLSDPAEAARRAARARQHVAAWHDRDRLVEALSRTLLRR